MQGLLRCDNMCFRESTLRQQVFPNCQSSVCLCIKDGQEHTDLQVLYEVLCRSVLSGAVG